MIKLKPLQSYSNWILRAAYLSALLFFSINCFYHYKDQQHKNTTASAIRKAADRFALADENIGKYIDYAIEANHQSRSLQLSSSPESELEKSIDEIKFRLYNEIYISAIRFDTFRKSISREPGGIFTDLLKGTSYINERQPFRHYDDLMSTGEVLRIGTADDVTRLTRYIIDHYRSVIRPSNEYIKQKFRKLQFEQSRAQGTALKVFLLYMIGGTFFLAVAVFLPFDLFLRNLFKKLVSANLEAEKAADKAHEASRAKSDFLANMSHEIRTPMNGVMGMAELLMATDLDNRQRNFTDIIMKSGSALLVIINDILDFSKISAGQMTLREESFNPAQSIEDVATLVSTYIGQKDIEVVVRIDPFLPEKLIGDAGRFRQIITNLMGNAIKFTENGHVFINAMTLPDNSNDNTTKPVTDTVSLRIEIEDTGIGIPEEKLDTIFDHFSQVDSSTCRKHEGTGLGLAITSSLINMMNGTFGVRSVLGKGSNFWFEVNLPVDTSSVSDPAIPMKTGSAHILVVDDNDVNRSILSEQLKSWGYNFSLAESGAQALSMLGQDNHHYSGIILDYHMPEMNGREVLENIRRDKALDDIPVVMLTSIDDDNENEAFRALRVAAHLVKPARGSDLKNTLASVLCINTCDEGESLNTTKILHKKKNTKINDPTTSLVPGLAEKNNHLTDRFDYDNSRAPVDILICEDNTVNRMVFEQILSQTGYSYKIVENGAQGVDYFEINRPRLIIMDVSMPVMNGLDATRKIRAIEGQAMHTPVLGVTAHALVGDSEKCFEAGMDDYLTKPISPVRLLEKIDPLLRNSGRNFVQA